MIKVTQFELVHFKDLFIEKDAEGNPQPQSREILLIYALGEDGVVYELSGGKWTAFPITPKNMREL